jgi:probable F420-dependent oxidoreductase
MVAPRPFRFGTYCPAFTSLAELTAFARKIESLGISTLAAGSHEAFAVGGPLVTLGAVAAATTTLRLTSQVFNNELRHPALLAGELATLDVISGGRVEIGIGAGWLRHDHEALGVPFDQAGQRVARLVEAVQLIKQLYAGESVTFAGEYYRVNALSISPKPVQHPHPPLFIGGGGRRVLSLAGREADIVGLDAKGTPQGTKDIVVHPSGWRRERHRQPRAVRCTMDDDVDRESSRYARFHMLN